MTETDLRKPEFIFVGGIMRSGTSLVQKMLDLHPSIYGGPEMGVLNSLMQAYGHLVTNIDSGKLAMVLSRDTARDAFRECLHTIYRDRIARHEYRFISEKTPANLMAFEALSDAFPAARFIWVIRDPRDVLLSMQAVNRRARERRMGAPGNGWVHEALLSMRSYLTAGEAFQRRHPDRLHVVYYEDVLADPRAAGQSICNFIGLPFDEKMLATEVANDTSEAISSQRKTQGVYYTREMFDRPIDPSSQGKWMKELDASLVRATQAYLGHGDLRSIARYNVGRAGKVTKARIAVSRPAWSILRRVATRLPRRS